MYLHVQEQEMTKQSQKEEFHQKKLDYFIMLEPIN